MIAIGGILFAGFGHLFHLHGLYYSVVLLFLSLLFYFYKKSRSTSNLIYTTILAVIAGLFHPLALLFHIFYLIGNTFEKRKNPAKKHFVIVSGIILLEIILLLILSPGQKLNLSVENLSGLMGIFQSFEANKLVTVFLVLFGLLSVFSLDVSRLYKIYFSAALIVISAICYLTSLPLLIVAALACSAKLIYMKRWTILSLLIITFFFTIFTNVESGHLKFFILFVLAYSISLDWKWLEDNLAFVSLRTGYTVILITVLLVFLLKSDFKIPLLSKLSNSILAKKESTYQLEDIIDWYSNSEYKAGSLILFDNSPEQKNINCTESIEQNPTSNENLQIYLTSLKPEGNIKKETGESLYVFFNNCSPENFKLVHSLEGKYSRNVSVYLLDE